MTPVEIAAHQAADRDEMAIRLQAEIARRAIFQQEHVQDVIAWRGDHSEQCAVCKQLDQHLKLLREAGDRFVRAFLAGARHLQEALVKELDTLDALATSDHQYDRGMRCSTDHLRDWLNDLTRVEPLINSPTPSDRDLPASPDNG